MPADSLPSAARPPDISRALPQLTGRIKKALPHSTGAAKLSRHRAAHFSMRFIGCPTEKDRLLSSISGEKYRLPGPAAQLQQLTCMALQIGYRPFFRHQDTSLIIRCPLQRALPDSRLYGLSHGDILSQFTGKKGRKETVPTYIRIRRLQALPSSSRVLQGAIWHKEATVWILRT